MIYEKPRAIQLHRNYENVIPSANVNPFTLPGMFMEDDSGEVRQAPKRLALQDSNITRYEKKFVELSLLAVGEFGLIYSVSTGLMDVFMQSKKVLNR